ncbi:MAG: IS66 family insertion sequence element accessory protein TnpB [Verrucomicrobiota bacterium]
MWGLSRATRYFLRAGPTDLRLGFDGLFALVQGTLGQDPLSGHVYLFCNRSRTRIKALCWDGSGLWLSTKRLEKGTFAWLSGENLELEPAQLHALVAGLEIGGKREWYRR